MGKRIEFDDAARAALWRGVDQLAGAVRVTLGPRGRNVVIHRRDGPPTITNDGLTIAREIELENPFENMGVLLLREVATKTGETAGDGTTTATVLAHRIVGEGLRAVSSGAHPMAIKRGIDHAVGIVVDELRRLSTPIEGRADIVRVASVAANHDRAMGELIAEALERVGRQGMVSIEDGHGFETKLEVVEGLRFDRGYLSPYFVTDPEAMSVTLENALVLLTDVKLSSSQQLLHVLETAARTRRPLLVVADDVEGEALAMMVVNRLRGTLASVAVKAPAIGDERRALMEDLAVLTGARIVSAERGTTLERVESEDFGRVKRVVVDRESTTLVEGGGRQTEIRERLRQLERELSRCDSDHEKSQLRARLSKLQGGIAVVYVGGATEIEMRERRSRLEDALAATRAAIEEGVVVGGGVALLRAQRAIEAQGGAGDEGHGRGIVRRALEEPARQIADNAGEDGALALANIRRGEGPFGYDALSGGYGDLIAAGVLDAAKVARSALQNAASIGGLVLTTDAIVVEAPEEEGEEPPEE
ncbi:MAG TPA: chaperonin GroEL [Candidatus Eisenbacteria bacterium]|nr:chaperonin GroEL [Candidatus Eisenbacteria bacterium]